MTSVRRWAMILAIGWLGTPVQGASSGVEPLSSVDVRAAALLLSGQVGGDLTVRARLLPGASSDEPWLAILALDSSQLDSGPAALELEWIVYLADQSGRIVDWRGASRRFDPAAGSQRGLALVHRVEPLPPNGSLRALVRDRASGLFGVDFLTESGGDSPLPTPPGGWQVVTSDATLDWTWPWAAADPHPSIDPGSRGRTDSSPGRASPRRASAGALAAHYVDLVGDYFDDESNALEPLIELETRMFGPVAPEDGFELTEAVARLYSRWARRDRDSLPALLALHDRLYRAQQSGGRPEEALHSARLLEAVAGFLTERPSDEDAIAVAAAWTSLAGHQLKIGSRPASVLALESALRIAPEYAPAQLGIAAHLEAYGLVTAAEHPLRQYVRQRPGDLEGHLRLGIVWSRLGSRRRAIGELERVADGDAPTWMAQVATQELARLHAHRRDWDRALERLALGLERWPGDWQLRVQRAALSHDADLVPSEIGFDTDRRDQLDLGPSARLRYVEWPHRIAAEARADLRRVADRLRSAAATVARGLGGAGS